MTGCPLFCSGEQITEALRVQLDVQRRLHEQLEVLYLCAKHYNDNPDRMPLFCFCFCSGEQILDILCSWHVELFADIFFPQIQRKLQLRIEEQGKRLQQMFEEQLKASKSVLEPRETLQLGPVACVNREQENEDDAFEDVQLLSVSTTSGYNDAGFPSKIS
jgi:hypothetical protein